ncbi:MAG TPA: hypothetical protein VFB62_17960 [Polyangiaceae bacterium]|jgi:hypothetical protein|nr:hypothetical protein [Polyangiaceae bacterium]
MHARIFSMLLPLGLLAACTPVEVDEESQPAPSNTNQQQPPEEKADPRLPQGDELTCTSCGTPCGRTPCYATEHFIVPPDTEYIDGWFISSFEYWPYAEGPPAYPDEVGWGFYAGSPEAKKCMAASRAQLVEILADPPPELVAFREAHGVYAFYNWNNDYTGAFGDQLAPMDYQYLWLYNQNLIKWISETNRDGRCIIPSREELVKFASECINKFPNCSIAP